MKNNKGFSLVELIIVIAIMAILVGVMAPQLIKYINKAKVTNDLRTMDAIYQALIYAANDPVVIQDRDSMDEVNSMLQPQKLEVLLGTSNTKFGVAFRDTLGWGDSFTRAKYADMFQSTRYQDNLEIYVQYKGGFMNPIAMWATYTDRTGEKKFDQAICQGTRWEDIGDCICIQ